LPINAGLPEGNAGLPEGNAGLPKENAGLPEENAGLPEGNAELPEGNAELPEENAGLPEGNAGLPEENAKPRKKKSPCPPCLRVWMRSIKKMEKSFRYFARILIFAPLTESAWRQAAHCTVFLYGPHWA
jgi:hypothetical protein